MEGEEFFPLEMSEEFFSKMDEDLDYAFALSLQNEMEENDKPILPSNLQASGSKSNTEALGIVDKQWELIDPNPDIHALFIQYNTRFFYGKLDGVEVKWSPRMTLCAGVCSYEGRGGLCSVRLSLPLLKLRPRRDLVETLLHEMIHAYLFVTANNKDHDAHGAEFLKHMHRINKETGTRISVYHSFHNEVDLYRKHWWKCNGPCQKKRPFYGLVKRASNRAPGPRDFWYAEHQKTCGGTFVKIKEPEDYKKKTAKRKPLTDANTESPNIKKFLKSSDQENSKSKANTSNPFKMFPDDVKSILSSEDNIVGVHEDKKLPIARDINVDPFSGKGFQLGSSSSSAPLSLLARIRQEMKATSANASSQNAASKSAFNLNSVPLKNSVKPTQKNTVPRSSFCESSKQPKADNRRPEFKSPVSRSISTASKVPASQSVSSASKVPASQSVSSASKSPKLVQSSMKKFVWSPSSGSSIESLPDRSNQNQSSKVECPVCSEYFSNSEINRHLDVCLQA